MTMRSMRSAAGEAVHPVAAMRLLSPSAVLAVVHPARATALPLLLTAVECRLDCGLQVATVQGMKSDLDLGISRPSMIMRCELSSAISVSKALTCTCHRWQAHLRCHRRPRSLPAQRVTAQRVAPQ